MEQIITARHNPTGQTHEFTFSAWIVQKAKVSPIGGGPLYTFISVNKKLSTSRGSISAPPSTPKKKSGCGCGK